MTTPATPTRRAFLAAAPAAACGAALAAPAQPAAAAQPPPPAAFRYALNTGTIRGYRLPLAEQVALAAAAGYAGLEPWLSDLAQADATAGALDSLRARCADAGLAIVSAIGFAAWAVDDPAARAKGLEQLKRDMDLVRRLGGTHIAAPPAGVNQSGVTLDLDRAAERYRAVLEIGREHGVTPQLEFWGASANLSRLDQCLYVAARAGHPDACILADVYHLYRGGSDPAALRLLGRAATHCFHLNDYPAQPPRETLRDADRVWPGDGVAPLREILRTFRDNGATPWLSLELFNPEYWKQPAPETARTGLAKMRAAVEAAL